MARQLAPRVNCPRVKLRPILNQTLTLSEGQFSTTIILKQLSETLRPENVRLTENQFCRTNLPIFQI